MKKLTIQTFLLAALFCAHASFAGNYATDIATVGEAQAKALEQARQMLTQTENPTAHQALQKAIEQMERAGLMLADAKKAPEKLGAAVIAEESAYQGLLKIIPHDFQVSQSRGRGKGGGRAGQPRGGQLDQLELTSEENRYETERQATAAQTPQQKEQLQIADRLKQLAQRQQDLNDRLKELQTALAEARTDQEREDIQRQLKRLSDEERQTLADVDELRQSMDQSPNASSLAKARQQLEKARSDTQRASQELQNQSVSQALAAGARAQQGMQELREDLKNQAFQPVYLDRLSGRCAPKRAGVASQEEKIGETLKSLDNPRRKSLDDSAQRQQLVQQMAGQERGLTTLLGGMQTVSGSRPENVRAIALGTALYDTLRLLQPDAQRKSAEGRRKQLIDHGLVSQAGKEAGTRCPEEPPTSFVTKVERAAQSVLGSETDVLRYAQKELDDLSAQVEHEAARAGTNAAQGAASGQGAGGTNNPTAGGLAGNGGRQASSQTPGQGDAGGEGKSTAGNQPGAGGQQASGQGSTPGEGERGAASGKGGGAGEISMAEESTCAGGPANVRRKRFHARTR